MDLIALCPRVYTISSSQYWMWYSPGTYGILLVTPTTFSYVHFVLLWGVKLTSQNGRPLSQAFHRREPPCNNKVALYSNEFEGGKFVPTPSWTASDNEALGLQHHSALWCRKWTASNSRLWDNAWQEFWWWLREFQNRCISSTIRAASLLGGGQGIRGYWEETGSVFFNLQAPASSLSAHECFDVVWSQHSHHIG